jgi:pilus assembly protein CpaE
MAVRFNLYYFSENTREYLQEVITASPQGIVAETSLLSASLADQPNSETDVCFVEYDDRVDGLDLWIEKIQQQIDHPAIYLYLREASRDTLLKAFRLGVQECFVTQISEEDFQRALQRLLRVKAGLNPGEKTQLISVFGCKGGTGATFVAVNLAQSLASSRNEPVLLVDLDLKASNVTSFLDITPRYTILDVIENFERIDPQYLKDIISSRESGFDVLPGPLRMEDSELVQAQHVEKILQYIRDQNLYRWIMLDLGDQLEEISLKAMEGSDLVLLITQLSIPGLRDAKKIIEMLQLLDMGEEKIQAVVNCYSKDDNINLAEAKKFLGQDFLAVLRFDHSAVLRSINEGKPLVETLPRHKLSLDFSALARELHKNGDNGATQPGRWFSLKRLLRLGGKK